MSKQKVSDAVLLESYGRLGNVWKVAEEVGLCGQTVHERLTKLNAIEADRWTEKEIAFLTRFYTERRFCPRDKFGLDDLAKELGRDKANVSRKARDLGLTNINRRLSEERSNEISERVKHWISENGHPKGMLGKHHTEEFKTWMAERVKRMWAGECEAFVNGTSILKAMKTKHSEGRLVLPRENVTWKGGNRTIGDRTIYFRSAWEANYARYLELLKQHGQIKGWEHEPDTFWFDGVSRGSRMYIPDFKIHLDDGFFYVEVKGWMDQKSKTKLERMARYYPEHLVYMVTAKEMRAIAKTYKAFIPDWESPSKK